MEYILSSLTILSDTIATVFICDALMPRSLKPTKFWFVTAFKIVLSFIIVNFSFDALDTSPKKTIVLLLFSFVLIVLCYKGSLLKCFFTAVLAMIFMIVIDTVVVVGLMLILKLPRDFILMEPAYWLLGAFVSRTVIVTSCYLFRRLRDEKNKTGDNTFWTWILILVVPIFTVTNLSMVVNSAVRRNTIDIWIFVDALGLLVVNIIIVFLLDKVEQEQQIRSENLVLHQEIKTRMESASALMSAYESQRRLTHDFDNHINALNCLLVENHMEQAQKYIANLAQNMHTNLVINTNNPIVNAVLNQKYSVAKKLGISMRFKINDLSNLKIKNADLVTILTNLLDNAIAACEVVPNQPCIVVKLLSDDSKTLLSIRNTSSPVTILNNTILTTKKNPLQHGFGLQNVKQVLETYRFEYIITYSDGWFQFTAMLQ